MALANIPPTFATMPLPPHVEHRTLPPPPHPEQTDCLAPAPPHAEQDELNDLRPVPLHDRHGRDTDSREEPLQAPHAVVTDTFPPPLHSPHVPRRDHAPSAASVRHSPKCIPARQTSGERGALLPSDATYPGSRSHSPGRLPESQCWQSGCATCTCQTTPVFPSHAYPGSVARQVSGASPATSPAQNACGTPASHTASSSPSAAFLRR